MSGPQGLDPQVETVLASRDSWTWWQHGATYYQSFGSMWHDVVTIPLMRPAWAVLRPFSRWEVRMTSERGMDAEFHVYLTRGRAERAAAKLNRDPTDVTYAARRRKR